MNIEIYKKDKYFLLFYEFWSYTLLENLQINL